MIPTRTHSKIPPATLSPTLAKFGQHSPEFELATPCCFHCGPNSSIVARACRRRMNIAPDMRRIRPSSPHAPPPSARRPAVSKSRGQWVLADALWRIRSGSIQARLWPMFGERCQFLHACGQSFAEFRQFSRECDQVWANLANRGANMTEFGRTRPILA